MSVMWKGMIMDFFQSLFLSKPEQDAQKTGQPMPFGSLEILLHAQPSGHKSFEVKWAIPYKLTREEWNLLRTLLADLHERVERQIAHKDLYEPVGLQGPK